MPDVIQIAIQAVDNASRVIGGVGTSLDKLGGSADNAEKKMRLFGLSTEQIGAKMTQAGKIATVGLTLPIAGLAVAATKAASDLNETFTKIDTLFGNASDSIKKFSDTAATSLGQSKKQALDAAADFAIFGKAAGLAGEDLVDFSKQNVQLAADFASFFNTSPEEAITAIGAAFRGESEPIRRYGVLINDAALKDEALRLGLIKTTTEALQPQARVLAAQALIMKQTTDAQGDFARTSGGLANQSRILNAQFQDTIATLGQSLLPIAIKMAGAANDLLKAFNDLDQPTKDLIVGFGLMAAAAGPVLTIGGKLIGVFGSIGSVAVDAAGGFITFSRNIGETAGYLKQVGVSAESLKFAFQNLKAAGAVLAVELGVIVAGLIAIGKYIEQVGVAAQATTDDLIAMSRSGDIFKQAAATTEILTNGQNRLKVALDGVNTQLQTNAVSYADYRSSLEATAKAAGYEIDAQGNLVTAFDRGMGAGKQVVQTNYALSESAYDADRASRDQAYGIDLLSNSMLRTNKATDEVIVQDQKMIDGLRELAEARTRTGDAEKEYQEIVKQTIDNIKAHNAVIADAYSMAIQYTESQKKQSDIQAELDALNEKIAARGPVRTALVKNEKLSVEELSRAQLELAVAQENLAGVQQKEGESAAEFALRVDTLKGKVADYSAKLGEHTAVVGGATKAEQEQKVALEEQIAALQRSDEVTRAKGAFESLTQAFRDGVLAEDEYKDRATALNNITGLYTQSALDQATAQEALLVKISDPRAKDWYGTLLDNKDALDGLTDAEKKAADNAEILASSKTLGEHTKEAQNYREELGKIPKEVVTAVVLKTTDEKIRAQAGDSMAERRDQFEKTASAAQNTASSVATSTSKAIGAVGDVASKTTDKVKGVADTTESRLATLATNTLSKFNGVASSIVNAFSQMSTNALTDIGYVQSEIDRLPTFKEFIYKITVQGEFPDIPGAQYGADFIVPSNPRGGLGDYFPVIAAPGERVIVQPRGQQTGPIAAGDTYNYTTNVYNPLAAAMLADQQRRDRLARSNARMGVV